MLPTGNQRASSDVPYCVWSYWVRVRVRVRDRVRVRVSAPRRCAAWLAALRW